MLDWRAYKVTRRLAFAGQVPSVSGALAFPSSNKIINIIEMRGDLSLPI